MTFAVETQSRLHALAARLDIYDDLDVECQSGALRVRAVDVPGCCETVQRRGDKIRCRARSEDSGRLWYYTSWREPIAQADQVIDAAVAIHGYVANTR